MGESTATGEEPDAGWGGEAEGRSCGSGALGVVLSLLVLVVVVFVGVLLLLLLLVLLEEVLFGGELFVVLI
jgi:hypothetical protein